MTGRAARRTKTGPGGKRTATALASPPAGWLSRALDAQKAGRLREAETLCRQALQSNPANPDACHLLARNLSQRGELREAAVMAARAAGGRPAEPMLEAIQRDFACMAGSSKTRRGRYERMKGSGPREATWIRGQRQDANLSRQDVKTCHFRFKPT